MNDNLYGLICKPVPLFNKLLLTTIFSREHSMVANRHLVKDHKFKIQHQLTIIPDTCPFEKIAYLNEMDC